MSGHDVLAEILQGIDGRGYKAYKDIEGSYAFDLCELFIDHVQGDPFATPSKIRVRVRLQDAGLPAELFENRPRRIGLQDYLARGVHRAIRSASRGQRGTSKVGLFSIDVGGQEVLARTAVVINENWVEARMQVGLPASGRRVLGRQAASMLCDELPRIAETGLFWRHLDQESCQRFVECVENQEHIRGQLRSQNLVSFVSDGSNLPRASGASDRPLAAAETVAFRSPERLRVTISLPNRRPGATSHEIAGMGIPRGITLIVGGGYHGKSTLLRALERGVYPHVPGDGREYVVTDGDVVKIRAEDGRRVERVDISPFISDLPHGRRTDAFCSDDASGSTSQAANIMEAVELGASGLLLDEDSCATNFMVRDARMQALVAKENEPITPFLDRVRELHDRMDVSTVMVMGGCGDYFDVADTVIMMREYVPSDVTGEAKDVAKAHETRRHVETTQPLADRSGRVPLAASFDASRGRRDVKIDAKSVDLILFGREPIGLRGLEQLLDVSQTRAIGHAIYIATQRFMDGRASLREVIDKLEALIDADGLDVLNPFRRSEHHPGNFARPRRYEIGAAINRLRTLRMSRSV